MDRLAAYAIGLWVSFGFIQQQQKCPAAASCFTAIRTINLFFRNH
jgi:hypothetical protein